MLQSEGLACLGMMEWQNKWHPSVRVIILIERATLMFLSHITYFGANVRLVYLEMQVQVQVKKKNVANEQLCWSTWIQLDNKAESGLFFSPFLSPWFLPIRAGAVRPARSGLAKITELSCWEVVFIFSVKMSYDCCSLSLSLALFPD